VTSRWLAAEPSSADSGNRCEGSWTTRLMPCARRSRRDHGGCRRPPDRSRRPAGRPGIEPAEPCRYGRRADTVPLPGAPVTQPPFGSILGPQSIWTGRRPGRAARLPSRPTSVGWAGMLGSHPPFGSPFGPHSGRWPSHCRSRSKGSKTVSPETMDTGDPLQPRNAAAVTVSTGTSAALASKASTIGRKRSIGTPCQVATACAAGPGGRLQGPTISQLRAPGRRLRDRAIHTMRRALAKGVAAEPSLRPGARSGAEAVEQGRYCRRIDAVPLPGAGMTQPPFGSPLSPQSTWTGRPPGRAPRLSSLRDSEGRTGALGPHPPFGSPLGPHSGRWPSHCRSRRQGSKSVSPERMDTGNSVQAGSAAAVAERAGASAATARNASAMGRKRSIRTPCQGATAGAAGTAAWAPPRTTGAGQPWKRATLCPH
jgi:hypothetical protein